ncbi:peptidyl-prolyl cis-trans isomerase [Haloferula chungangensis]|uniref:Peptidyl-prolyl cis-trans isomerase n=1 Tax=Haloferula chungangensis TaxID=1048331 RepID=A0ABW2L5V0_9BACT
MKLLRDPLVVFLLIGGGIFLLYSKLNPEESSDEANADRIEVTSDIQNMLISEWSSRWNRPPTPEEFQALLDEHIKEEILFREATKLGLDQADTIIRRRLAQKMEFLTADVASLEEVSDETLQSYYEENSANYRVEPEIGFRHLYFSTDKRKDQAASDASALLPPLNDGSLSFEQAVEQADQTLLSAEFTPTAISLLGRQFGKDFAPAIAEAEEGEWFGPVTSGYGLHLVKVTERVDGHLPELESIREEVINDYRYDQREKLNKQMLDSLLDQYEVVIDELVPETENTEAP